jgi:hypothetical protein
MHPSEGIQIEDVKSTAPTREVKLVTVPTNVQGNLDLPKTFVQCNDVVQPFSVRKGEIINAFCG